MIEMHDDQLRFQFSDVHPDAVCNINFQRTLRIPDDNRDYPLPPGLGRFPILHVDDFLERLPSTWREHGGVFLPMYQSEALWIRFSSNYPCAIKVAAGKVNAVTGKTWKNQLSGDPQDYVVVPRQPWLDGFNVAKGYIRQFVAMPLGEGYTAEEQISGKAEHGGLQIIVYPMKRERYLELMESLRRDTEYDYLEIPAFCRSGGQSVKEMGLAPGGLMRQEIYEDTYGLDAWDQTNGLRCFVHLANSTAYQAITGHAPPQVPPTAKEYSNAGLPWFEYYSDGKALEGSSVLSKLISVAAKTITLGQQPQKNNEPVQPKVVKTIRTHSIVRDGSF